MEKLEITWKKILKKAFLVFIILMLILVVFPSLKVKAETTTTKDAEVKYDYTTLKQMMQEAIDEKDFSELANYYLMEIFEHLYKNYPSYQKVYKDFPNVDIYINDNLIEVVKKLKTIALYERGTPEADEIITSVGTGYTNMGGDIILVYSPEEESLEDNLEGLFHEITHNNQSGFSYGILLEGGATFHAQFVRQYNNKSRRRCKRSC